jgi:predicted esterase
VRCGAVVVVVVVKELIDAEIANGLPSKRIAIIGFSQGLQVAHSKYFTEGFESHTSSTPLFGLLFGGGHRCQS